MDNDPIDINRDVVAAMPAAVAVMTLVDDEGTRRGMTISSLTPVSADPPSVLMCIGRDASARPSLIEGRAFCANLLASDQSALSAGFAYGEQDPFTAFEWTPDVDGAPVLSGTAAHLLCRVERVVEHHGTAVVLAGVTGGSIDKDEALVYWKQAYFGDLVPVETELRGSW